MNDESLVLDYANMVEVAFEDATGRYEAIYVEGRLTRILTKSVCQAPLELGFSLQETLENINALGYGKKNGDNSFTMVPPTKQERIIRFVFVKGALCE